MVIGATRGAGSPPDSVAVSGAEGIPITRHRQLSLSGHALLETSSVLTRLPGEVRLSAADAVKLIDDNFPEVLQFSAQGLVEAPRELARLGITGGAAYDGVAALAAREHGAVLATRDARARSTYQALGVVAEICATA